MLGLPDLPEPLAQGGLPQRGRQGVVRVISLFSGAGGLDLGFMQAGHRVVWANDIAPDACATYRRNIGAHIVESDIAKVDAAELPPADIVVGGFPCQGFSRANINKIGNDRRNYLFRHFARIVAAARPMYFFAENVRGLVSFEGGRFFQMVRDDFRKAGYRVSWKVLNAADFGVPQSRVRVIIVGVRVDLPMSMNYQFPAPTHAKSPLPFDGLKPWVSVGEALKGLPEPGRERGILNHIGSRYKVTNRDFTGHRMTDPDKPSPTILARSGSAGGVSVIQHPRNHRRMTIRESAVVQSFPMNFEFKGGMGSCYRQVGNAVPVLLARCLAGAVPPSRRLQKCA